MVKLNIKIFLSGDGIVNDQQQQKYIRMTTEPVGRLVCQLAVPTIISMMVTAAYNMADTFFVGMLHSNSATGAVGVVFSLMAIIQAVGFFFGHGSGNYISMELGRKNTENASKMAAAGVTYAFLTGAVILLLGQIFLTPLARLLGSTETILPYARDYLRIILIGAPYMTASFVLNNQLRFQGSATYGMIGIVAGAILNVGLDPLLIFVFDLGIRGAALATIISQFASFCLLLVGCTRGGNLRIRLCNVEFRPFWLGMICKGGFPSLCRQGLMSVATICLNRSAGVYGDAAIAAMSVVQRTMMMANSALIGFGQGFQPVCGFNHGAKLYGRVRQGYWFCVKWATLGLAVLGALLFSFAPQIIAVFRDDPQVIAFGTVALRFQSVTIVLNGFNMISGMTTQTLNRVFSASLLAVARQGVFFIPIVLIAPHFLGELGIQIAQSVSDVCSMLLTIPLIVPLLRELRENSSENGFTE
ncbi:MAG: MATE family efflux transporter [Clostridiales bacterium]|nr:MATE family efflux transporter [Candidatus Cacconaster stercorequi]